MLDVDVDIWAASFASRSDDETTSRISAAIEVGGDFVVTAGSKLEGRELRLT
jgi:hypothetical protein